MAPPAAEPARSGLLVRVLSALVLLPLAVGLVYAGGWYFTGLVTLAAVLMAAEWQTLLGAGRFGAGTVLLAAALVGAVAAAQLAQLTIAWLLLAAGAAVLLVLARLTGRGPWWQGLGALWFGLPCVALVWLRQHDGIGFVGTLWVLVTVWACDTGAYFAGRTIGGPKLAPRFSPKKTWAGLIGGMAAAALAGWAFASFDYTGAIWGLAGTGAAIAAFSQVGDLAESAVKRHFGVKDSGALIPGHGGVLDRVDGLLFAAPVAAILVYWGNGVIGTWR